MNIPGDEVVKKKYNHDFACYPSNSGIPQCVLSIYNQKSNGFGV